MWTQALTYRTYGGPDVLELVRAWVPEPGPEQVRIRVKSGGVNPLDTKLRAGIFSGGLPVFVPTRIGGEFAGVIESVGEDIHDFQAGDAVFGLTPERNAHAEMIIADPRQCIAVKPSQLSFEAAASIAAGGLTAFLALNELAIGQGDTLIVHGASGGVGSHVVQIARLMGAATVIGTASPANHDYLRDLGAVPIAYGEGLSQRLHATVSKGAHIKILDTYGRESLEASIDLVQTPATDVVTLQPFLDEEFGVTFNMLRYDPAVLRDLSDLYAAGKLTAREPRVFPVADATQAHRLVETKRSGGKVVLQIG